MSGLTSYMAIENILKNVVLADFQCVDVVKGLASGNAVYGYGTGLGKTVVAAALVQAYINEVPSRRFIYLCKPSQLLQTPAKIVEFSGLKVSASSAAGEEIHNTFFRQNFLKSQLLIVSYNALVNPAFVDFLYKYRDHYYGIIVDEAHEVANFESAISAGVVRAMLRQFKVRFGLTATPVTKDPAQLARLAYMFDWEKFPDVKDLTNDLKRGDPETVAEINKTFLFRTRADLGISGNYRTHLEVVPPHEHQVDAQGGPIELFKITKGPGALNQANKLIEIVRSHPKGMKGVAFIHFHENRKWVESILDNTEIRYESIHGKTDRKERGRILELFKNREIDLILTSVESALDIDADYVIFYEYTGNIKQMLGRVERGLNPKTLDIHFIFTQQTAEGRFFLKNVYRISLWIQEVLKQDYSTLVSIGDSLKLLGE